MIFRSRCEKFVLIYFVVCLCLLKYVRTLAIETKMLKNQSSNAIDSAPSRKDSLSVEEDSQQEEPDDIFDELIDIFEGNIFECLSVSSMAYLKCSFRQAPTSSSSPYAPSPPSSWWYTISYWQTW